MRTSEQRTAGQDLLTATLFLVSNAQEAMARGRAEEAQDALELVRLSLVDLGSPDARVSSSLDQVVRDLGHKVRVAAHMRTPGCSIHMPEPFLSACLRLIARRIVRVGPGRVRVECERVAPDTVEVRLCGGPGFETTGSGLVDTRLRAGVDDALRRHGARLHLRVSASGTPCFVLVLPSEPVLQVC